MTEIILEQGYEIERPSRILIQVDSEDDAIQTVKVGGQVVMVVEGTLIVLSRLILSARSPTVLAPRPV